MVYHYQSEYMSFIMSVYVYLRIRQPKFAVYFQIILITPEKKKKKKNLK